MNISQNDEGWATRLHAAIRSREAGISVIETLLQAQPGWINVRDPEGKTPLDIAEELKWQEVVDLLIKHGAKRGIDL